MLREEIAKTREAGYACMEGHLINGMTGLAVPLRNPAGCVVAALSIAAIEVRLDSTRRAAVVRRLKEASLLMGSELGPVLAEI
jgi:DNA-binding IclR family transcriptional regulator